MDDVQQAIYEAIQTAQKNGEPAALATIVSTQGSMPRHEGSKMLVYPDGTILGTVGGGTLESRVIQEAINALNDGKTRLNSYTLNAIEAGDPGICGGTAQIFIEPIAIAPTLIVVGTGHVGKAVAECGKWLGFRVILNDDREEFCNASYLPGMDEYVVCKPDEIMQHVNIHQSTYIAATTRGVPFDVALIPELLKTDAAYIGVIGSKRRWSITVKELINKHHIPQETLNRIHSPIGLELEAETPKEIAVSILAEMIMLRRGGTGKPMKWLGDKEANP